MARKVVPGHAVEWKVVIVFCFHVPLPLSVLGILQRKPAFGALLNRRASSFLYDSDRYETYRSIINCYLVSTQYYIPIFNTDIHIFIVVPKQ